MLYNGTLYLSVYVVLANAIRFYNYVIEQMRKIRDGYFEVYRKDGYRRIKVSSNFDDMMEALPRYCRYYNYYLGLTPKEMEELVIESL